jgi:hypothetical protein
LLVAAFEMVVWFVVEVDVEQEKTENVLKYVDSNGVYVDRKWM